MKRLWSSVNTHACTVLTLTILAACTGQKSGESKPGATATLLPSENLPAETLVEGQAQVYAGNELSDYIDGGADLFLEFGFVEAAVTGLVVAYVQKADVRLMADSRRRSLG